VIPTTNFWITNPEGRNSEETWGAVDENWQEILKFIFKDVERVIAEVNPTNPGYTFFSVDDED
jgi:hypothetical protein